MIGNCQPWVLLVQTCRPSCIFGSLQPNSEHTWERVRMRNLYCYCSIEDNQKEEEKGGGGTQEIIKKMQSVWRMPHSKELSFSMHSQKTGL